ncbi:hypothetical protein PS15m_004448 [Mucor circinelloides]
MKVSVAPLMMRIVTTRGGDKPNLRVTIKLKRSIKLKWPTIDKLYKKAKVIFDCSNSNAQKASKQDASHTAAIGDKIDLRECTSSPSSKTVDLLSVAFAKDSSNGKPVFEFQKQKKC